MKTLIALLIMTTSAAANMPPKEYDHAYRGPGKLHAIAVPFGDAGKTCEKVFFDRYGEHYGAPPEYGCSFSDVDDSDHFVIYSFDTPSLAKRQHRTFDAKMRSNTFRHERGHINGWPSNHPNALP